MWGAGQMLAEPKTPLERPAPSERSRQRMHSGDTEALQSEIDRLRVYVTSLFQLLIARGVFTEEEAKRLVAELDPSTGETDEGYRDRDVVTGEKLPPQENPFRGLAGPPKSNWRLQFKRMRWVLAFFLFCFFWLLVELLMR